MSYLTEKNMQRIQKWSILSDVRMGLIALALGGLYVKVFFF